MAAALALPRHHQPRPAPQPRRPELRVLEGGASEAARRRRAMYLRRRVGAAVIALVVVAAVALAAAGASSLLSTDASPASAPASATAPVGATYVVQPGDTLWSIAGSIGAEGDVRAVVHELSERTGGSVLQPGQRIPLDGLVG